MRKTVTIKALNIYIYECGKKKITNFTCSHTAHTHFVLPSFFLLSVRRVSLSLTKICIFHFACFCLFSSFFLLFLFVAFSPSHSHTHSLTHTLTHSLTHSLTCLLTHSHTHTTTEWRQDLRERQLDALFVSDICKFIFLKIMGWLYFYLLLVSKKKEGEKKKLHRIFTRKYITII